jgi:hypothetical protein
LYDFGDDWRHSVLLEGILLGEPKKTYPVCTGGEMACPPEDSGGVYGYRELLEAVSDEDHPDHEQMTEWLEENLEKGEVFDPVTFSPAKVKFSDAAKRWKAAYGK